jgi:hypothetical protein
MRRMRGVHSRIENPCEQRLGFRPIHVAFFSIRPI